MKRTELYGRADHSDFARAGGGLVDRRRLPQARDQQRDLYGWKAKFGGLEVYREEGLTVRKRKSRKRTTGHGDRS